MVFLFPRHALRILIQDATGSPELPELPLYAHATFKDPGGVAIARHSAIETTTFRTIKSVSFRTRRHLLTTTLQYFRAQYAAYVLAPPLLRTPRYLGRTWASLLTYWLDFSLVGLGISSAPTG